MSHVLQISMDDEVMLAFEQSPEELAREMRLAAAVKWYELGKISQEMAAQVAGLSRAAFLDVLSRFGVSPFQETAEDIASAVREN